MYEYKAEIIRVIDADTLEVLIDLGLGVFKKERVRLARIDAPEIHGVKKESLEYVEGMKSTEFVIDWSTKTDSKVILKTIKDRKGGFGRYLVEVYGTLSECKDVNLNDLLLKEGLAVLYK